MSLHSFTHIALRAEGQLSHVGVFADEDELQRLREVAPAPAATS